MLEQQVHQHALAGGSRLGREQQITAALFLETVSASTDMLRAVLVQLAVSLSIVFGSVSPIPPPGAFEPSVDEASETPLNDEPEALYNAGVKLFESGDLEAALRPLEASLSLQEDANTRFAYGQVLKKLDRCSEAVREFERVLEAVPEGSDAERVLNQAILSCANDMADTLGTRAGPSGEPSRPVILRLGDPRPITLGKDPGRSWEVGGITSMGVGAFGVVSGIGMFAFYSVRGREFSNELGASLDEQAQLGCNSNDPADECSQVQGQIDTWRDNGNQANTLRAISLGVGGGLGVLLLVAGGLAFREGKIRTAQWRNGRTAWIRVVPTGRGVSAVGRF